MVTLYNLTRYSMRVPIPPPRFNRSRLLGLVGNVISIVVLSRPQMKSSINVILIGLASADTILITTSILG